MLWFQIAIVFSAAILVVKTDSDQQKVAKAVDTARTQAIPGDSCCLSTATNDDCTVYKLKCYYKPALTQAEIDAKLAALTKAFNDAAGAAGSSCTLRTTSTDKTQVAYIITCDSLSSNNPDGANSPPFQWHWFNG